MSPDTVFGECRSCKAPIRWAITAKGKRMPLDPDPNEDGNVTLKLVEGVWHATVHGNPAEIRADAKRFISHFATCPFARQHRRGQSKEARS